MIYQLLNKRTEVLAITTYHIAHLCNQYNHVLKQKLRWEHNLKGTLRKQSNKHQNSQKTLRKANKKNINCMPKTAVLPDFKAHQLGLAGPK